MSAGEHRERPVYVPTSTYRLQVHAGFPLAAVRDVIAYLRQLGVDACYTSPYFTASPGSTHGYDVCNHNEINPELGGEAAYAEFARALTTHGVRHIVDFVPNHMGIGTGTNAWWNDVLENGPSSPSAGFFDVDWTPVKAELHAKLLLPILGDQYGRVLERGELQLAFKDGVLVLRYSDQELPINPRQAPRVYGLAVQRLERERGAEDPQLHEFQSIIASLQNMPPYTEADAARAAERQREKEVARARLARLVGEAPAIGEAIEDAVRQFNGTPGQPSSFDALHELLETQAYRLSHWRTASHEINYRRFFDVNTLAGLRVEHAEVFDATHQLLAFADSRRHRSCGAHRSSGRPVRSGAILLDAAGPRGALARPRSRARRRAVRSPPLRRRGEDPVGARTAASALGRAWHDRLQLPERSQRRLRGRRTGAPHAAHLRQAHRPGGLLRRCPVCEQAADHGDRHGERAERARARAGSDRREQPEIPRLHAREPSRRHHRGGGLLPGVSHLCGRTGMAEGGSRRRSHRPSPAPGAAIRPWKRRCSTSSAKWSSRAIPTSPSPLPERSGGSGTRPPMPPRHDSGCVSR